MASEPEVVVPQKETTVDEPKTPEISADGKVVLSKEELAELKHKAEVSSQNFERLKKEQEKAEALEAEIAVLRSERSSSGDDERVGALLAEVAEIKAKQTKAEVMETYPALKEVWSEFEKFRDDPDNKGMSMKTAAKAFMAEKGITSTQPRRGLEKPTGGDRTPISSGMTSEEAKRLRETDYKKYSEMVRKGQIKVS